MSTNIIIIIIIIYYDIKRKLLDNIVCGNLKKCGNFREKLLNSKNKLITAANFLLRNQGQSEKSLTKFKLNKRK